MILLLGASGYIGRAFEQALRQRGWPYCTLSRQQLDYTRQDLLLNFLKQKGITFLMNAAGYTGKPNVDACETARLETFRANAMLPAVISQACFRARIPWGHVSTGCIYSGARILQNGRWALVKDLSRPEIKTLAETQPELIQGFSEIDRPNFTFRSGPCSFYSGTKALAEEFIAQTGAVYVWRLRIPFDEIDGDRNYLSKLMRYSKAYDNVNSLSHRGDFVNACLDLWERRAAFGVYNLTNPGFVTTRQVTGWIQERLQSERRFEFWSGDEEFYRLAAKAPRSNCVLDTSKAQAAGVILRPVQEAVEHALRHWRAEDSSQLQTPYELTDHRRGGLHRLERHSAPH